MRQIVLIDPSLINTHKVDMSKAFRYAKAMEQGDCFPPVWIYKTNASGHAYKCKNGAHRLMAYKMLGRLAKAMLWKEDKNA